MKEKCKNCSSTNLRWYISKKGPSDVVDGRIRMSEVYPIAYLACEECSETIRVIEEDEINAVLNHSLRVKE